MKHEKIKPICEHPWIGAWINSRGSVTCCPQNRTEFGDLNKDDFKIRGTKELVKPFVVGDTITGVSVMPDRFLNTTLIRAKGRTISVPATPFVKGKKIKVEITRDKHNIFTGKKV